MAVQGEHPEARGEMSASHGAQHFVEPGVLSQAGWENRGVQWRGVLSLGVAAMLTLAACGDSEDGSRISLPDAARSFEHYPLYYVGESYDSLPLSFAGLGPGSGEGTRRAWSFGYGDCEPPEGEGGCPLPLEVQNWSICTRFPSLYPGPTPKTESVHGAQTLPAGGGLDVYTGRTTVVIFGQSARRAEIVESLRRVADDVESSRLPPPVPGALEGKLACQRERLERFSN
jgi:hypothetical protein